MSFNVNLYVCRVCGSDIEIDYEYHEGSTAGLKRDEVSVYCTNDECGEADIFTGIAISRKKWEKKWKKKASTQRSGK